MALPTSSNSQRGVFGYLPAHPDLVRVRASSREVRAMENWLERGLHQARWEMGGHFVSAYSSLTHRMVFRPDNSDQALVGVLYASQDSNQRTFPFVAFELLPTEMWDRSALDIVRWNEALFGELEGLVQDVASLSQLGQIHSRILQAQRPLVADDALGPEATASNETRYQNFLDEVTCGELGPGKSGAAICRDLWALLRGDGATPRDPRSIRTAIELPLQRPPLARALELRFYIELCHRLLWPAQPTLTMFWKLGGPETGSLVICFREPTIDVFCGLLRRGSPSRGITTPGRSGSAHLPDRLPIQENMPLKALLQAVSPQGSWPTAQDAAALRIS